MEMGHLNLPRMESWWRVVQRSAFSGLARNCSSQSGSREAGGATSGSGQWTAIGGVDGPFVEPLSPIKKWDRSRRKMDRESLGRFFGRNFRKCDTTELLYVQGVLKKLLVACSAPPHFCAMKRCLSARQEQSVGLIDTQNAMG